MARLTGDGAGEDGRAAEYLSNAGGISAWMQEHKAPDAAPGYDEGWTPFTGVPQHFT